MIGGASSEREAGLYRVLIRPNQSLSSTATVFVVVGFAVVSLSIGIAFAVLGFWLVLPFAGMEVALVASAFWLVSQSAQDYDLLCVEDPNVVLYQHRQGLEKEYRFKRAWVKVRLEKGERVWHSPRLMLGSHGKQIEIGRALTADRRRALAAEIRRVLRIDHGLAADGA